MSEHPSPVSPRTPAAGQPHSTYRPTADEEAVIRLSQEWMQIALVEKDERRLRDLMAPEFTLQIWDASRAAQDLDAWMSTLLHRLAAIEFKYTSLSARVFGDVGVVYSAFWWQGTMDGQPFKDSGFIADVWSRESGTWRVVARRSAPQQQIQQLPA
jgi:ketosteroid isomerase-like protein